MIEGEFLTRAPPPDGAAGRFYERWRHAVAAPSLVVVAHLAAEFCPVQVLEDPLN